MNPQTQPTPNQAAAVEIPIHDKLTGISLVNSVLLGTELSNATIGRNVDSITPARIDENGRPQPLEKGQQCQGFLLRAKARDGKGGLFVNQAFVGWANIKALTYG
jgi:hypothetical protein